MNRSPLPLLLLAAALAGPRPAAAAETDPAPPLTLDQAFARALAANPELGGARAGVGAADAQRRALLSNLMPRLELGGKLTRNSEESAFGEGDDARVVLPEDDWNYRLTLTQPVFAGNRERRAYEQAKLQVDSARLALEAAREALLLRVATDFLGVVQGDELVAVERRGVELAAALLAQARSFFAAGEATEVEIRRAEAGLKAAERRQAAARQRRETAAGRLRLDLAWDRAVDRAQEPSSGNAGEEGSDGSELAVAPPPAALFAAPLPPAEALVADALARRPELRAARNDLAAAGLEVRKQRGFYLPVVTFDATYQEQKSPFPSDAYGSASIRLTQPLFTSGETAARVRAAGERETQARLALEAAERRVAEEVRRALLDLETAETSLALAAEQAAAAQAEHDQTFELYRAQEATALDVRQAETSLADARRAVVESGLERDLSRARVWYAAGALGAALAGDPPSPTRSRNDQETSP